MAMALCRHAMMLLVLVVSLRPNFCSLGERPEASRAWSARLVFSMDGLSVKR